MRLTPRTSETIERTITRHPALAPCRGDIEEAVRLIVAAYEHGGKVLTAGNGGSSADADHIVGELMKRFAIPRPLAEETAGRIRTSRMDDDLKRRLLAGLEQPLPAVNLASHTALNTAFANDADPQLVYAQALLGFARPGDVLIAISTSGNSDNIVAATALATALDVRVVSLTGEDGGRLAAAADTPIRVPAAVTAEVQEYHLPVYHCICAAVEAQFFG